MTEWEREREKEEFIKAGKMYKPLAGMIASRFTRAKFDDTVETVDVPAEEGVNLIIFTKTINKLGPYCDFKMKIIN